MRALLLLPLLLTLSGCGRGDDGGVDVAIIGEPAELFAAGSRLAPPGELVRAATMQGLVRIDEAGQVIPGIAERWIVTADGESYIFRIREVDLPGGKRVTARTVQQALSRAIADLKGTTLGLDLAQVRDVRAMTGRVIEIRLKSPMPGFLQLLAQPELGIAISGTPTGPMSLARVASDAAVLTALPPEARGLPAQPDWAEGVRAIRLSAGSAAKVTREFSDGRYALVLGGTLATLPLADVGPLSRGTVRLDSALGLFGLDVRRAEGFLADSANREALAMALDRTALLQPFNIAGWVPTTRVVAPGLPDDPGLVGERWQGVELDARRAAAASRVARWRAANGGATPVLSLAVPVGPGADILFTGLAAQYREIGIVVAREQDSKRADLALRHRVARYAGARWFLNQFHCGLSTAICSEDVDFLVELAVTERDPVQQARYLAEAESALANHNAFIPIGAPIRWSLVRSGVSGFAENLWAAHPLFPFTRADIERRSRRRGSPMDEPKRALPLGIELPTGTAPADIRRRMEAMEKLLERSLVIPGTKVNVGLDAVLGVIPVLGDVIAAALGAYLIWEAKNLGLPKWKLWRMAGNIAFDSAVGAIPVAGDLFDFAFRSNSRNLKIVKRHLDRHHPETRVIEA